MMLKFTGATRKKQENYENNIKILIIFCFLFIVRAIEIIRRNEMGALFERSWAARVRDGHRRVRAGPQRRLRPDPRRARQRDRGRGRR